MYRLIEKLHLERYLNTRLILAIDLAVSGLASLCALVSVKLLLHLNISDYTLLWLCCSVVYSFVTFYLLKTYHSVIRHSTLRELSKFVVATFSKEILLGLTVVLYPPAPQFSLHILALLLLDLLLTLCGLILIRVAMIIIYDLVKDNLKYRKQRQQVLVYGLSEKSVSLVTRLQSSPHYKIVGFLTFGRNMKNHTIAECPVYYFENEYSIRYLRQRYDIDAVLFPTNEEAQAEQERLIRYCVESNLKILIAPPIDEVIDGKIMRQSIREIKIEDLLGRPEIKISLDEIIANFREKTVMVTGAAGSIGSELCRQLASFGIEKLILFDNAETPMHNLRLELEERFPKLEFVPVIGDIRLPNRLDFAFRTFHPQVVFHAAAYKHVPLMEEKSLRSGAGQCHRHTQRRSEMPGIQRRKDGDDLDRQSRESHQYHGLYQTPGRNLRTVARAGHRTGYDRGGHEVRNHPFRKRPRLERLGNSAFPRADRQGRTGNGHPSGHHPFLHDHSRGLPAGHGSRNDLHRQSNLRFRYG